MKISKAAKNRLRMMSQAERKKIVQAAEMLCLANLITYARYSAIFRTVGNPSMTKLFKL